uniref:DH domain-containing protein n=1 Tax=Steinernema glaseri TaxID=37863 RepID=A0A1I7YQN4_9BILA
MEELSAYFAELQRCGYMKDIVAARVFLNYSELYRCNLNFWKHSIYPMLNNSRDTGEPLRPHLLKVGFDEIREWSKCYIIFNFGHADSHCYVQKRQKDHEMFREFVIWAESQDTMRRQKLIDTLSTPMQRLTRYVLLLKAVLKATDDVDEKALVQAMIDQTEAATMRLNFELNNNDLKLQLAEFAKTLESYDAVDNDEAMRVLGCGFDITLPMPFYPGPPQHRRIILRGDLKMREGRQGPKVDTHCILFTDMLLICKATSKRNDRFRVIKPPMHIKDMIATQFLDYSGFYLASKNEFEAPTALYLMFSSSTAETDRWVELITRARMEFIRDIGAMRQRMHYGNVMDVGAECYRPMFESNSHFTTPDHSARMSFGGYFDSSLPTQLEIAHRKSSSMDSQVVAQAHAHLAHMRKSGTVSSAEQLDRFRQDSPTRWLSRGKQHLMNGLNPALISQSKSSVDLYLPISATEIPNFEECSHQRSRSNSSSREVESPASTALHNRSDSATLLNGSAADKKEVPMQRARSPSFVITSTDDSPDIDLRRLVDTPDLRESPGTPCTGTPPISESPSRACTPNTPPTSQISARRFEKRYHTADGSELTKPKSLSGTVSSSILKRFSFNVQNAVSAASKKTSSRLAEQHNRRNSQTSTLASSESFCSSTSGISSASSRDNNNVASLGDGLDTLRDGETLSLISSDLTPCEEKRSDGFGAAVKPHVSTVAVGEHHSESCDESSTLRIDLCSSAAASATPVSSAPPLPAAPPPSQIPNGECKTFNKHQDLLKFIMENHLETSDV